MWNLSDSKVESTWRSITKNNIAPYHFLTAIQHFYLRNNADKPKTFLRYRLVHLVHFISFHRIVKTSIPFERNGFIRRETGQLWGVSNLRRTRNFDEVSATDSSPITDGPDGYMSNQFRPIACLTQFAGAPSPLNAINHPLRVIIGCAQYRILATSSLRSFDTVNRYKRLLYSHSWIHYADNIRCSIGVPGSFERSIFIMELDNDANYCIDVLYCIDVWRYVVFMQVAIHSELRLKRLNNFQLTGKNVVLFFEYSLWTINFLK